MGTTTKKTYKELEEAYQNQEQRYNLVQQQLDELRRMIFGQKSERFVSNMVPNQLSLELGDQKQPPKEEEQASTQTISYTRKKKKSLLAKPFLIIFHVLNILSNRKKIPRG